MTKLHKSEMEKCLAQLLDERRLFSPREQCIYKVIRFSAELASHDKSEREQKTQCYDCVRKSLLIFEIFSILGGTSYMWGNLYTR